MKLKSLVIILLVIGLGYSLSARNSVTFLTDGNTITGTMVDISSRNGMVDYWDGTKIHRSRIWMINYAGNQWDFPAERNQLSGNTDTIFLSNGHILNVNINDFSSRRQVFEFNNGGSVHEGEVLRVYFCCNKLPAAYKPRQEPENEPAPADEPAPYTFVVSGDAHHFPLSYINNTKTGFVGGLQINTQDVWMINFEDEKWNFPDEREQLNENQDTIFLWDGEVLYDVIIDYSKSRQTFRLENTEPLKLADVKRIYFCCNVLPDAYSTGSRRGSIKQPFKRKVY